MTRWSPLLSLLAFVSVGLVWRSWLQRRRFGNTGLVMFQSGAGGRSAREALILVLGLVLFGQAIAVAVDPHTVDGGCLPTALPAWLGTAIVGLGIAVMVAAQLDLGASWRVGIDEDARPGLVRGGLYRVCRNPIFVAMLVVLAGFTLLVPTWLSLGALVATAIGFHFHVKDEEAYLLRTYGADYADYARRVGRFVPGIGRLG